MVASMMSLVAMVASMMSLVAMVASMMSLVAMVASMMSLVAMVASMMSLVAMVTSMMSLVSDHGKKCIPYFAIFSMTQQTGILLIETLHFFKQIFILKSFNFMFSVKKKTLMSTKNLFRLSANYMTQLTHKHYHSHMFSGPSI